MGTENSLKGPYFNEGVDVTLFAKDPVEVHAKPSFSLGPTNQSSGSEKRERSDSIRLLKETLHAISESDTGKKAANLKPAIPPSASYHDLVGLNFQIEIPKKTLTVPRQTYHRHSVSLPVTPQTSPKLERKGGLLRKASGTNLKQMGILPEHSSDYSSGQMEKRDKNSIARKDSQMKTKAIADSATVSAGSGSQPAGAAGASWLVNSGFGNWLQKKTKLDNKEMNAMAPTF